MASARALRAVLGAALLAGSVALDNPGISGGVLLTFDEAVPGLGGSTAGYPTSRKYLLKRVLPASVPGFLIAAIFLVYLVLWLLARGCSVCFTKRCSGPSCHRWCGYPADAKVRSSSKCKRCAQFFFLLVALAFVAPSCGVGSHGVKLVSAGITDLTYWMEVEVGRFVDMASLADAMNQKLRENGGTPTMLAERAKAVKDRVDTASDYIRGGSESDYRAPITYTIYAIFIAVPLLGVASYCWKSGVLAMLMTGLALLCLVITWAIFGATFLTAVVVNDTCAELTKFHNFEPNSIPQEWCVGGADVMAAYTDVHHQADDAVAHYGRRGWMPAVASLHSSGLSNASQSYNNFEGNRAWRHSVRVAFGVETAEGENHSAIPSNGSSNCFPMVNSPSRACTREMISASADGMMAASYVLSCQYMDSLAKEVVPKQCSDTLKGFVFVFCAHGLIGFSYVVILAVGLRAQQDWSSKAYVETQ